MRYYKSIADGYLIAIGTGSDGTEITEDEYSSLMAIISSRPTAPEGCSYRLTEALAWEQYELPPADTPTVWTQETLAAMTNAELEQLLSGYGISGSMNKANMIRMLLLAQGGVSL